MPGQLSNFKFKKRYTKRKENPKKKVYTVEDVKKLISSSMKSMISKQIELKSYNYSNVALAASVAGAVVKLTPLQQGLTESTIIGTQVKLTSHVCKFTVTKGFVDPGRPFEVVRMIWFLDADMSATNPIVDDVLQNAPLMNCDSVYNQSTYNRRIRVLKDQTYALDNDDPIMSISLKIPINKKLVFNGDPTTPTNQGKNHLYLLYISNIAAAVFPNISYDSYVFYKDG